VVEAEVAAITLGARVSAIALPNLTAALHFGRGATLLVDDTMPATGAPLQIRTARAGVTLTGRRELAPLLELHDVTAGDTIHAILDLTSADAIIDAAQDALNGIFAALLDALTSVPQARALAALGGLVRPATVSAGDPWPDLVSVPKLFTAPGPEFAAYHARVLAEPDAWRSLAAELATLLRTATATTVGPGGEGTPKRLGEPCCSPMAPGRCRSTPGPRTTPAVAGCTSRPGSPRHRCRSAPNVSVSRCTAR
jgi:hypothetical protein